jgi:hypothetical protein
MPQRWYVGTQYWLKIKGGKPGENGGNGEGLKQLPRGRQAPFFISLSTQAISNPKSDHIISGVGSASASAIVMAVASASARSLWHYCL